MNKIRQPRGERMEHASAASLSAAEVNTIVRRFGFILAKVHEVIMGRLVSNSDHELAESFNDVFKPLVDLLVHFDVRDEQ